jgi:hypothetical protein
MNDFDRTARTWLEDGPSQLSDRVLQAALDEIHVTRQRRSWGPARRFRAMNNAMKLAIAAAAVAVVAVAGFSLIPGDRQGSPSATPSPSSSPSASPVSFDGHIQGALEPGAYALDYHAPVRITFTVPAGWEKLSVPTTVWGSGSDTRLGFVTVDNVFMDPCSSSLGVHDPPVGPTVDDLATELGDVPGLEATTPTDVTLGGFAGKQVDLTALASWESCEGDGPLLVRVNDGRLDLPAPDPNEDSRWWILDVEGQRLVIVQAARAGATAADRAELEAIVDSIRLSVEPGPSAAPNP